MYDRHYRWPKYHYSYWMAWEICNNYSNSHELCKYILFTIKTTTGQFTTTVRIILGSVKQAWRLMVMKWSYFTINCCYNQSKLKHSKTVCLWIGVFQKQVSRVGTSNYIPQILWDVITCPCPWYLLLAHKSSYVIGYAVQCDINIEGHHRITVEPPYSMILHCT